MKTKTMKRQEWWRLNEYKFSSRTIDSQTEAGLIQMINLKEALYISYPLTNQSKCIADNGYSWLQIGFRNHNLWCTAMFDDTETLVECYFDVTLQNNILPDGNSYFEDLYLDIVFFPDGTIELLDEDELKEALNHTEITLDQYNFANDVASKCIAWLKDKSNQKELINFCNKLYIELKN
ncbi:DUF402 domain-containing protein [Anaerorhabdus sp.]|uniref:DUF402 domain-containing protein n=1 Tax=Anaerorhabdus sp. TaxID=1872524 RepID=UPI002FC935F0